MGRCPGTLTSLNQNWVVMLRNGVVPEGCFGGKIAILGGFVPENSTVPKPPKLGGHALEHPIHPSMRHAETNTGNAPEHPLN